MHSLRVAAVVIRPDLRLHHAGDLQRKNKDACPKADRSTLRLRLVPSKISVLLESSSGLAENSACIVNVLQFPSFPLLPSSQLRSCVRNPQPALRKLGITED